MKKIINIKNLYIFVCLLSLFSILSALYIEYVLGAIPCKLCIYQRIPYLLAIFTSIIGYIFLNQKLWLYIILLIFFSSFLLSGYHSGIENSIFAEFKGCISDNNNLLNKEQILNSFDEIMPNCKDVKFRILGFSLATLNMFISLIIIIISLFLIKTYENK